MINESTSKNIFTFPIRNSQQNHIYDRFKIYLFQMSKFSEGGLIIELWSKPKVEVFLKVYVFNITNKEAFLAGEEKLKVKEIGPYIFR